MAVAGRFMTKWLMVCGMVMMVGGSMGAEEGALRERSLGIEMVFSLLEASERRSSAAWRMNVWPSSQNGRT